MKPTILLGTALIPDTKTELKLFTHDGEFSIKIPGRGELMNTKVHGSEKALAELACQRMKGSAQPRVLVGGLGMGFTLAAALDAAGPDAEVVVAELVPEVVEWNRDIMGEASGHPLADPRSTVYVGDVADPIRNDEQGFDAILLDVDNGPEAMIRRENSWLYSIPGLESARRALRPSGVLAIWSAGPDNLFKARLKHAGFKVEEHVVRPHRAGKGSRHYIWLAQARDD
jgi:spermidine synthase